MMRTEPDAACVEWMSGERTPGQARSTTGHPVTPDGVNCRPTASDAVGVLVGPGGRERTAEEYAALLAAAGYELVGETPTAADVSVFEARAI